MTKTEYAIGLCLLLLAVPFGARALGIELDAQIEGAAAALFGGEDVAVAAPSVETARELRFDHEEEQAPAPLAQQRRDRDEVMREQTEATLAGLLTLIQPGAAAGGPAVNELASHPTEPPERIFSRMMGQPGARDALARPGRGQPLPRPEPPRTASDAQRRALDVAWARVEAEWSQLAGRVVEEYGFFVAEGFLRFATPELNRQAREKLGKRPPGTVVIGGRPPPEPDAYTRRIEEERRRTLEDLVARPTPGLILREAQTVQVGTDRYRDATLAYLAMLHAMEVGAELRTTGAGRPVGIRYPDGSAVHPIWQGSRLAGMMLVAASGEVTYLRRHRDGWRTGTSWEQTPVAVAGEFTVTPDGRVVRALHPAAGARGPTVRETRLLDGRRIVEEDGPAGSVRIHDARGRLVAVGPSADPARRSQLRYDGDRLVEVEIPAGPGGPAVVWRRNARGEWTDGRTTRPELEIAGTRVITVSAPTEIEVETQKQLRYRSGQDLDLGIYVRTRDGWAPSQDPADLRLVERFRELARNRQLPANTVQPDVQREPGVERWKVEDNWFVKELRAAGLASPFTTVSVSSDSPRVWDGRGGAGRLGEPWFNFTTIRRVPVQVLTESDLVTGRTTSIELPIEELDWFRTRHGELRAAGAIPADMTLVRFVIAYRDLKVEYYRTLDTAVDTALRHLLGDDEMARRGFGRRGRAPVHGILQLDRFNDPIFSTQAEADRYLSMIKGRAAILVRQLLAWRAEVQRRYSLARDGRFRALGEDEARATPEDRIDLQSLIHGIENIEHGLPTPANPLLAAVKHGLRSTVRHLIEGVVENPLLTAGLIGLGIINPALGLGVGTAMLLGNVTAGTLEGIDLILRGISTGNDELYYRGISRLSGAGAELGVGMLLTALAAKNVRGPAATPPGNGRAALIDRMTAGDAALARQLAADLTAERAAVVWGAWERAAEILSQGGRRPLPAPFRQAYENARSAYSELASQQGWLTAAAGRGAPAIPRRGPAYDFHAASGNSARGVLGAFDDGRPPPPAVPRVHDLSPPEVQILARFRADLEALARRAETSPLTIPGELRALPWVEGARATAAPGKVRVDWAESHGYGQSVIDGATAEVELLLRDNPMLSRAEAVEIVVHELTSGKLHSFGYDPRTGLATIRSGVHVYSARGTRPLDLSNPIEAEIARMIARAQIEEVAHGAGHAVRRGHYAPLSPRLREFEIWVRRPEVMARLAERGISVEQVLREIHEADATGLFAGRSPHRYYELGRYPGRGVLAEFALEEAIGPELAGVVRELRASGAMSGRVLYRLHELALSARDPVSRAALRNFLEPVLRRGAVVDEATLDGIILSVSRRLRYDVRIIDPVTGLRDARWPAHERFGELVDRIVVDAEAKIGRGEITTLRQLLDEIGPRYNEAMTVLDPDGPMLAGANRFGVAVDTPIGPTSRYARWGDRLIARAPEGQITLRIDGEDVPATAWGPPKGGGEPILRHTTGANVDKILAHCETLYRKALRTDLSFEETVATVAELHYYLAHATPFLRGSAAISDLVTKTIFDRRGIRVGPWRENIAPDLEALIQPDVRVFIRQYHQFFVTPPRPAAAPLGRGEVLVDSNVAIALEQRAAGTANAAHLRSIAVLEAQGAPRVPPTVAGEFSVRSNGATVPAPVTHVTVSPHDARYLRILGELERPGSVVGGTAGAHDRAIVAEAFFTETAPGVTPTLISADRGVYNNLARLAGIDPARVNLFTAHPNGFTVTLSDGVTTRTIRVIPVAPR